jgi:hypothetical protein
VKTFIAKCKAVKRSSKNRKSLLPCRVGTYTYHTDLSDSIWNGVFPPHRKRPTSAFRQELYIECACLLPFTNAGGWYLGERAADDACRSNSTPTPHITFSWRKGSIQNPLSTSPSADVPSLAPPTVTALQLPNDGRSRPSKQWLYVHQRFRTGSMVHN